MTQPDPTPPRTGAPADPGPPDVPTGTTVGTPDPGGPHRPTGAVNQGPVAYKGAPLDAGRGPGLGCFWFQIVALVILIVLTPLSVGKVPDIVTALLLFATIGLLLVSGQTIIFLLRIVAADRRGRREPLAPRSPTVGQLEEEPPSESLPDTQPAPGPAGPDDPPTGGAVRQ